MGKKKQKKEVVTGYEEAIAKTRAELNSMSPWDNGYDEMLKRARDLEDLAAKNKPKSDKISKDALLQVGATIGMFVGSAALETAGHRLGGSFTRKLPQFPFFKRPTGGGGDNK